MYVIGCMLVIDETQRIILEIVDLKRNFVWNMTSTADIFTFVGTFVRILRASKKIFTFFCARFFQSISQSQVQMLIHQS